VTFLTLFYLTATPIGANLLVWGLAHGLKPVATPEQARGADAVVILSGGIENERAGGVILAQLSAASALRVLEGARVFKLIGARVVVVSGGVADPKRELKPEGEYMAAALVAAGVPADAIALDLAAKNTFDHPRTVRPLLEARHVSRFVIVTSPTHMRRALAVFRAAGFDPVASVSLMRSDHYDPPPLLVPDNDSLMLSHQAFYDYAAWVYYLARGRM
jgi:uncharacterized SAM-binding protein YcdF (DUF218 family)